MASTRIITSLPGKYLPVAKAINAEGAPAYALNPKQLLAQYAATGCLNATYYANATQQLAVVLELSAMLDPAFVAKTAIYCRERGYMKDMPALLTATLTLRGQEYLPAVFGRVINNGKMLRNFVQVIRGGVIGRKSLGSRPKKLVQAWLNKASERELLSASIGMHPSLADVVKMVHPKPAAAWREAFFAWLIGKPVDIATLPPITSSYLDYKADQSQLVPDVPFQMLTSLELDAEAWARIAEQCSWQTLRINLNTFARHGVFNIDGMAEIIASKLRDATAIAAAQVFPFQLLAAWSATGAADSHVPSVVREALQDALDISLANVPVLEGKLVICADVSASMSSPLSGQRGSATSAVRCIDVAALVASALLRSNPGALVLPFSTDVVAVDLRVEDTVFANAAKLATAGGGGTNCSAPLAKLNRENASADMVVFVSDNQSWLDACRHGATATMEEWAVLKQRAPHARLVCIDIQPGATTQAAEREDILNIGGFSDDVFRILAAFAAGELHADHWVGEIEAITL